MRKLYEVIKTRCCHGDFWGRARMSCQPLRWQPY